MHSAVNHFATPGFWFHYRHLSPEVRELADKKFELLRATRDTRSLRFKKIGQYWSARVGLRYRALAKEREDGVVWFWIGSHDEYEELLEGAMSFLSQLQSLTHLDYSRAPASFS